METARKKRYLQKLNVMLEKIRGVSEKPINSIELDASLFRIQIAIEAATDLAAMLVKDLGLEVSDDYHNFDLLQDKKIISELVGDELKKANGLRNAIVHKYNKFEQEVALQRIPLAKKALEEFAEIVEEKVNELASNKD